MVNRLARVAASLTIVCSLMGAGVAVARPAGRRSPGPRAAHALRTAHAVRASHARAATCRVRRAAGRRARAVRECRAAAARAAAVGRRRRPVTSPVATAKPPAAPRPPATATRPSPSPPAPIAPAPSAPTTPAPATTTPTQAPAAPAPAPTTPPPATTPAPPPAGASWSTPAAHIETWAYDDGCNGGTGAGPALVQQWLSYAETNCGPGGDAKSVGDCRSAGTVFCDVIQYLDTNWIYRTGSPTWQSFTAAASEGWWQHAPGSSTTRVSSSGFGGGYLVDQANPSVQSFFQGYARGNYDGVDGLMMDDQSPGLSMQLYYSTCGCSATNEVASDAGLQTAHAAMSAAMTHSDGRPFLQVDNTLPPNPYLPQGLGLIDQTSGVQGLLAEGEPESNGTLDPFYSTLLDQIAYVADETTGFVVPLSYAPAGASYQAQTRRVQEATMLLGYSPGHLADWANLEVGNSDLAVWPEEGIYPTQPVQSMAAPGGAGCLAGTGQVCATGGHNDVQVAPGVYRREFAACYDQGVPFGACAAVVNTTSSPVTVSASWLTQSYAHQITMGGGDVQSGGTLDLQGAPFTPGSTTVAADDALLLGA